MAQTIYSINHAFYTNEQNGIEWMDEIREAEGLCRPKVHFTLIYTIRGWRTERALCRNVMDRTFKGPQRCDMPSWWDTKLCQPLYSLMVWIKWTINCQLIMFCLYFARKRSFNAPELILLSKLSAVAIYTEWFMFKYSQHFIWNCRIFDGLKWNLLLLKWKH